MIRMMDLMGKSTLLSMQEFVEFNFFLSFTHFPTHFLGVVTIEGSTDDSITENKVKTYIISLKDVAWTFDNNWDIVEEILKAYIFLS